MSDVLSFIQKNGAGLGILTVYTAILLQYFFISSKESPLANFAVFAAVAPAIVIYEVTKEYTGLIIQNLLEQHVAIARLELDLQHEGDFEAWYSGDNVDEIDELDSNSRKELTTALCALVIGASAPFAGWFSFGLVGIGVGLVVTLLSVFAGFYALRQIVETIERTPKVVQT